VTLISRPPCPHAATSWGCPEVARNWRGKTLAPCLRWKWGRRSRCSQCSGQQYQMETGSPRPTRGPVVPCLASLSVVPLRIRRFCWRNVQLDQEYTKLAMFQPLRQIPKSGTESPAISEGEFVASADRTGGPLDWNGDLIVDDSGNRCPLHRRRQTRGGFQDEFTQHRVPK
jgi:hypothetical protein